MSFLQTLLVAVYTVLIETTKSLWRNYCIIAPSCEQFFLLESISFLKLCGEYTVQLGFGLSTVSCVLYSITYSMYIYAWYIFFIIQVEVTLIRRKDLLIRKYLLLKGTVSRDFWPVLFLLKSSVWAPALMDRLKQFRPTTFLFLKDIRGQSSKMLCQDTEL